VDSDCESGLECWPTWTTGMDPPGCTGTYSDAWDYCYDPTDLNTLNAGEKLWEGEMLMSLNLNYKAKMQSDGNFVIYKGSAPLSASHTSGQGTGPYKIKLQKDDNLVIYDSTPKALWSTKTGNKGTGDVRLIMQNGGNLVLYDSTNKVLWSSNTKDGRGFPLFGVDGNHGWSDWMDYNAMTGKDMVIWVLVVINLVSVMVLYFVCVRSKGGSSKYQVVRIRDCDTESEEVA